MLPPVDSSWLFCLVVLLLLPPYSFLVHVSNCLFATLHRGAVLVVPCILSTLIFDVSYVSQMYPLVHFVVWFTPPCHFRCVSVGTSCFLTALCWCWHSDWDRFLVFMPWTQGLSGPNGTDVYLKKSVLGYLHTCHFGYWLIFDVNTFLPEQYRCDHFAMAQVYFGRLLTC